MRRTWAIYDVYLGHPVLVERCDTRAGALQIVKQRSLRSCGAVHIVEQLLPDGPHLLVDNESTANEPSGPAAS
jgi:hypothetical protein